MKKKLIILVIPLFCLTLAVVSQSFMFTPSMEGFRYLPQQRYLDSLMVTKLPVLTRSASDKSKLLPPVVNNSRLKFFPGIRSQYLFMSCLQHSGIGYTFSYEINRLRDADGSLSENRYPPHYTWNLFNQGNRENGVNFIHSFEAVMNQGHMTRADYGPDTAFQWRGWPTGYDKYYRGMKNKLKKVYTIPTNSEEGILTIKQYLFDHLDGSPTGGAACFIAFSPNFTMILPPGTPEAGKHVMVSWGLPIPTHGMTLIGYNDSIRFDYNGDGKYTNDIDLNLDGQITPVDWEIGGFLFANSYGTWWADTGFCYVQYRAMAEDFDVGGPWNNCVFVLVPDPDYEPSLSMKLDMSYNRRNSIKIMAGVNSDTSQRYPAHTIEFPVYNYMGGPYPMQGIDSLPDADRIELGLDVSPLLGYIEPGKPGKFFLEIESFDTLRIGEGKVHQVSFINHLAKDEAFVSPQQEVEILDNGLTLLSAIGIVAFNAVEITTESLPPFTNGQNYSAQLSASGGISPYTWSLIQKYHSYPSFDSYSGTTEQPLIPESNGRPYARVILPFSFPFMGKTYDSLYVHLQGMIHFEPISLPYPFQMYDRGMLENTIGIFPAFAYYHTSYPGNGDGMWMSSTPDSVTFRWKLSVYGYESLSNNEFEVRIFPDGHIKMIFGPVSNTSFTHSAYQGLSGGTKSSAAINHLIDLDRFSETSSLFLPPVLPEKINLTEDGLLEVENTDSTIIYALSVRATDARGIFDEKTFTLSNGLSIEYAIESQSGFIRLGEQTGMALTLSNKGMTSITDLSLNLLFNDDAMKMSDSTEIIGTLAPGETKTISHAFSFGLDSYITKGYVEFLISANAAEQTWALHAEAPVAVPVMNVSGITFDDGDNELPDPGEVLDMTIRITNSGLMTSKDVATHLTTNDTLVTILTQPSITLDSLESYENSLLPYVIRVSRNIPSGTITQLEMHVTTAESIDQTFQLDINLGRKQIGIVNLSTTSSTPSAMSNILDSLGIMHDRINALPDDPDLYSTIFLILGTNNQGSHSLNTDEALFFSSYLNNGGKLYLESYSFWYYSDSTYLHHFLKYTSQKVSPYLFDSIFGKQATFSEGMKYQFNGPIHYAPFAIEPVNPAYCLFSNNLNPDRCLQIAYDGEDYKSIGTLVEFGKLIDTLPLSTRENLMLKYLEFFRINTDGPYPLFHAEERNICKGETVSFLDDSFANVSSWSWEFPGGSPATSSDANPVVLYANAGDYDISLTVSDGTESWTLNRKAYIHVDECSGIVEKHRGTVLKIFPNPADDEINVMVNSQKPENTNLRITDLQGRTMYSMPVNLSGKIDRIVLPVSNLLPGLYMVSLHSSEGVIYNKLVVR